jgi:hypothetical protein
MLERTPIERPAPQRGSGPAGALQRVPDEPRRGQIGQTVHVHVTSTLQTSAGRLVFAKPASAA